MSTLDEHGLSARIDRAIRLALKAVDELMATREALAQRAKTVSPQAPWRTPATPQPFTPSDFDLNRVDL